MKTAKVYFDGTCGLCNIAIQVGRDHGKPGSMEFIDNGSKKGKSELNACGLLDRSNDTLIVEIDGKRHEESSAAMRIAWRLKGVRRLNAAWWIVPKPVRDAGYRWVARNRYKWFGRVERSES